MENEGKKILLIEEDQGVIDIFTSLFSEYKNLIQIITSKSENNFLDIIESHEISLIVNDLKYSGEKGLEFQRQLKNQEIDIPVILITGHDDENIEQLYLETAASSIFRKPLSELELKTAVIECLDIGLDLLDTSESEDISKVEEEIELNQSRDASYYYETISRKNFIIFRFLNQISKENLTLFYTDLIECIIHKRHIIIDLFLIDDILSDALNCLEITAQQLNIVQKNLRFIHPNDYIKSKLKLFVFSETAIFENDPLFSIESLLGYQYDIKSLNFIKCIMLSTIKTFFIQNYIPCNRRKSYLKNKDKEKFLGEVTSSITVNFKDVHYFLTITFPKDVYLIFISKLLGENYTEVNDDNKDGVGEFLNIIIGNTKGLIQEIGSSVSAGIPTLNTEKDYLSSDLFKDDIAQCDLKKWHIIVVPFKTQAGNFFIELAFPGNMNINIINELIMK